MMENEEQMLLYFDDALENVPEHDVLRCFMKSLEEIEPSVNGLEVLNSLSRLASVILLDTEGNSWSTSQ